LTHLQKLNHTALLARHVGGYGFDESVDFGAYPFQE
jgi:hypothetical protein